MNRIPPIAAAILLAGGFLSAEVPNRLHHQGRVAVNGVNFDGAGSFKFLLFTDADANHANGDETAVWKNDDAAPANMTEPLAGVPLLVSKGLYALNLGDTGQAALPVSLEPAAGRRLYLRIWFDNGINGLQQLAPDQEMAAVPFARHAETASGFSGNLNLGSASITAQTFMVGQPGQTVSMTSSPDRLTVVGDLEVEGSGTSLFLGNVEVENQLIVGTVNSGLSPHVNNTFDLGIPVHRWRQLFLGPLGLSIGQSGDAATLSFDVNADLLTISGDTHIGGQLSWGEETLATEVNATAWGDTTLAAGISATAWGVESLASGENSTAWGRETKAGGLDTTAWGRLALASGDGSTAWGHQIRAHSYLETALGQFNTNYTENASVAWDPADRLFVIGNGTSDTSRSDALIILKNGASSFGGAVSVAGDLNVTGAVNYGSLNLPANVMLEGEGLGLLNNDAGFLASPGGTVEVPESQVQPASMAHISGKHFDGLLLEGIFPMSAHPAGIVASYLPATQELVFLNRHVSGVYQEVLRLSSPSHYYEGYTISNTDGLVQIAIDPTATFNSITPGSPANMAFVLNSANKVRAARFRFYENQGFLPGGAFGDYEDNSVNPNSHFTHLQGPSRASIYNEVMAVISAENAVTFIDTSEPGYSVNSLLTVHVASPTMPIASPSDVVVGVELAAVAALGTETVQLFGINRTGTIDISVKGKITDGENGFTRIQNPNLLAFNHGSLLAISSTTDNAITLANVSDTGSPQLMAVIEGAATRMIFQNATTLLVLRSGHISVLDVSTPGSPVEKMRLTSQNLPGLLTGNNAGFAMSQPGELAVGSTNQINFLKLDAPAATQSLAVSGWLGLGVDRAYAPLHVQGNVLVDNAKVVRLDTEHLKSTASKIELGTGAYVTNEGVAIGSSASASNGGTAIGSARAEGQSSLAMGNNARALGGGSVAIGNTVRAESFMETVLGGYNSITTPLSRTNWEPQDQLFVIGNGYNGFSDALVMLKNGNTTLNGSLTVNGGTTINGGLHLTGAVTGGGLALLGAANVFTQDVTTQADYKYATPKTVKRRVHARAFAPAGWFTSREVDFDIDGDYLYLEDTPTQTAKFNAGVDLPAGAVIKKLQIHYMDDQGQGTNGNDDFDATLTLRAFNGLTGGTSGAGTINLNTTGRDPDIKMAEVTIINHIVSANNAYGLHFTMTNCAGNDLRFYGVTIEYETTAVQP